MSSATATALAVALTLQGAQPAAEPAPAPATTEDHSDTWDTEPTPEPPPPTVAPAPAPSNSAPPPADAPPPRSNAGQGLLITGVVLVVVGGASLVFIAAPSAIVKSVALDRASRDPLVAVSSREDRYRRARRADDAMEAGFWIGVGGIGVGLPLLITGAVIRSHAREEVARRLDVNATGVTVRF